MIGLEKIIADLLYEKECVIVPEFGAFVSHEFSSEINRATQLYRPPSKRITFRTEIKEGDETLIMACCQRYGVLRSESISIIRESVREWKRKIASGDKLFLPHLGRFYKGDDASMHFSASIEINFSRHSFGLPIFRTPASARDLVVAHSVNQAVAQHIEKTSKKTSGDWVRVAAVAIPVVALIYLGSEKPDWNLDTANLFSFDALRYSRSIQEAETPAMEDTVEWSDALEGTVSVDNTEEMSSEITPTEEDVTAPEAPLLDDEFDNIPVNVSAPYQVVVGSFGDPQNAINFVESLRGIGFHATILNENSNLHKVSVEGFDTHEEATMALRAYKLKVTSAAWIYHK